MVCYLFVSNASEPALSEEVPFIDILAKDSDWSHVIITLAAFVSMGARCWRTRRMPSGFLLSFSIGQTIELTLGIGRIYLPSGDYQSPIRQRIECIRDRFFICCTLKHNEIDDATTVPVNRTDSADENRRWQGASFKHVCDHARYQGRRQGRRKGPFDFYWLLASMYFGLVVGHSMSDTKIRFERMAFEREY